VLSDEERDVPAGGAASLSAVRGDAEPTPRPAAPPPWDEVEIRDARLVSKFVWELMCWSAHIHFVDKLRRAAARPTTQPSALARLESTIAVGIIGSGNSGSKGVWGGEGPVDALIDAAEANTTLALVLSRDAPFVARHRSMPDDLAELAVWIRDETQGESPKPQRASDPPGYVLTYEARRDGKKLRPERRITGLSLAEIVGLSSADALQRARWEAKMMIGDSGPARAAMLERGEALLLDCARAWFGQSA
jgi:hypothetical protein